MLNEKFEIVSVGAIRESPEGTPHPPLSQSPFPSRGKAYLSSRNRGRFPKTKTSLRDLRVGAVYLLDVGKGAQKIAGDS